MIDFHVPGVPIPQGSTTSGVSRTTGKVFTKAANPKQKGWRRTVAKHAALHAPAEPYKTPLTVAYLFVFEAPKSRAKTQFKHAGWVPHTVTPDLDKLIRCVNDAMSASVKGSARVMVDDGQVWETDAKAIEIPNTEWTALYPATSFEPGVYITVAETRLEQIALVPPIEELTANA